MRDAPVLAAVDWGTSRLRLWLLDAAGKPLVERRTEEGLAVAGARGFEAVLERNLAEAGAAAKLPVIICGMAGSRQGWVEAPYVKTPAALSDIVAKAVSVPGTARDIRIIPGLAQRSPDRAEVMRGEETLMIGIAAALAKGRRTVCMPGTHSKWVDCETGRVMRFRTWMTGELFALLSRGSILRHSMAEGAASFEPGNPAFAAAVRDALDPRRDAMSLLFAIRADALLNGATPENAAARLSGLLIGTEVAAATAQHAKPSDSAGVTLIAHGALASLYAEAFKVAGLAFDRFDADIAVQAGLMQAARETGMLGRTTRASA